MKTKTFFLSLLSVLYFGCSSDDSSAPSKEIHGSLFVTVKEPDGKPVKEATINIGDLSGLTDEDGTYFFPQITLTGDDFLQVEKAGYFKGSRRFTTKESNTQFLRVTLLPQAEIGNFSGAQSASIPIDSKSSLTFPDHAITRADGSAYNGNVHVFANPIYGDDPHLSEKMPGALKGLDQSGAKVALGSFGMLAVELQSDNGEVLKLASGKTVEMQLAIPNQQLGKAPSTIPLWYFDEAKGYWVEEGQATRQGNSYVAQLPHFSYWNCDQTFTLINWEASFTYTDGNPAQNNIICLTILSTGDQRCEITDANGVVSGPLPANEAMEINVENDCGKMVYTKEIGPFTDDIKMNSIALTGANGIDYANITGTALQCDGSPLSSGYVKVHTALNDFIFAIKDATGHYEGRYAFCSGDVITLKVYDVVNHLVSLPHVITFDRDLDAGSLRACEQVDEYIRYKITGFSREYIYYLPESEPGNLSTSIYSLDSIGVKGKFGFSFDGRSIGQYKGYTFFGNQINIPNGQVAYINNMNVNVTEYGSTGEYIRGNFSGKITAGGNGSGGNGWSDYSGSFSVIHK